MAGRRTWKQSAKVRRPPHHKPRAWGVELTEGPHLQQVKQLVERAYPRTGRLIEVEMEARLKKARAEWPVKTGDSKESIGLVYRIQGDLFRVSLVVTAEYADLIRSGGIKPARRWILDVAEEVAERVAKATADEINR